MADFPSSSGHTIDRERDDGNIDDIKGHMIAGDVLNWVEERLGNTVYEEFEF